MELFNRLIAASSSFTLVEHLGTCLEMEPQLFFSLYQISLLIISEKNPCMYHKRYFKFTYNSLYLFLKIKYLMEDGRMLEKLILSISAFAWKLVNNRKNLNFSRDKEREMSTEHTLLLFFSRYLTGCKLSKIIKYYYFIANINILFDTFYIFISVGRLVPLAMLLAHSMISFWIFYSVHVVVVSITLSATFIRRKVRKKPLSSVFNDDSFRWNNVLCLVFTISSLYCIADFRLKEGNLSETVYYAVNLIFYYVN